MTTKTLLLGALALGGAWLVFGSSSQVKPAGAETSPGKRLPLRPGVVVGGVKPPVTNVPSPLKSVTPRLPSSMLADINRPTSGVTNLGTIGADGAFRGMY